MTAESPSQIVSFEEILGFLRRRSALIAAYVLIGGIIGYFASAHIPKKFKSKSVLTIQSGYFHHPLISDFVAEIRDNAEMSTQRAALLRLALDDTFLEHLDKKYFQKKQDASSTTKQFDPEALLKRIEYFSTNATSFQLSVTANSPEVAFHVIHEVLTHIISTLEEKRYQHLMSVQKAVIQQAELLQSSLSHGGMPFMAENPHSQLGATKSKLAALQEHLSETHPDIVEIKSKLTRLTSQVNKSPAPPEPTRNPVQSVFFTTQSQATAQDIFEDLLKKISDMTIVLQMEQQPGRPSFVEVIERPRMAMRPFFPKREQVAVIGAVIGLIIAVALEVAAALRRNSQILPHEACVFLAADMLGELPILPDSNPTKPPPAQRFITSSTIASLFISQSLTSVG